MKKAFYSAYAAGSAYSAWLSDALRRPLIYADTSERAYEISSGHASRRYCYLFFQERVYYTRRYARLLYAFSADEISRYFKSSYRFAYRIDG